MGGVGGGWVPVNYVVTPTSYWVEVGLLQYTDIEYKMENAVCLRCKGRLERNTKFKDCF